MKKITKRKKAILILYSYILLLMTPKISAQNKNDTINYNIEYNIDDNNLFASYNNKNIYIGKRDTISAIIDADMESIYIFDARENINPNMAIYNSYKITNIDDITIILKIIDEYEKQYPSNWNRTINSMKNEWLIHNICYYLNIEQSRAKEVDLDNDEEDKYHHFIKTLIEIIKNSMDEKENNENKKLTLK